MKDIYRLCVVASLLLSSATLAQSQSVNIIVDMEGVDQAQYQQDLQSCQGTGTQVQNTQPEREGVVRGAARGAAIGAAAGAVSGNSGSKGAKTGAGAGVAASAIRNSKNRREAKTQTKNEREMVVKNCMRGRGYNVLN